MAIDRLPREERQPLQKHLDRCPECRVELARLRKVSHGVAQWSAARPEKVPSVQAQHRLRQALQCRAGILPAPDERVSSSVRVEETSACQIQTEQQKGQKPRLQGERDLFYVERASHAVQASRLAILLSSLLQRWFCLCNARQEDPRNKEQAGCLFYKSNRFGLAAFGAVWGLILFLNLDSLAPATMQMAERSQPAPPKAILTALMSKKLDFVFQTPRWQSEPAPLPPHSRRSCVYEITYC
jgi:hypothetical protein